MTMTNAEVETAAGTAARELITAPEFGFAWLVGECMNIPEENHSDYWDDGVHAEDYERVQARLDELLAIAAQAVEDALKKG